MCDWFWQLPLAAVAELVGIDTGGYSSFHEEKWSSSTQRASAEAEHKELETDQRYLWPTTYKSSCHVMMYLMMYLIRVHILNWWKKIIRFLSHEGKTIRDKSACKCERRRSLSMLCGKSLRTSGQQHTSPPHLGSTVHYLLPPRSAYF